MSRNSLNTFNRRNRFNLSKSNLLTCDMGYLVPVYWEEVLPGDVFKMTPTVVARMMPMLAPMMSRVDIRLHFFHVPLRLLFDDWEKFRTGGKQNNDTTVAPYITIPEGGFAEGTLADYLGIPTGVGDGEQVSALPFRAYAKIYNEWWRPENLEDEVALSTAAGSDSTTNTTLLKANWAHDYYTDGLPWPQRGDPVYLPLGTSAPVVGNGTAITYTDGSHGISMRNHTIGPVGSGSYITSTGFYQSSGAQDDGTDVSSSAVYDSTDKAIGLTNQATRSGMIADLRNATSITVDALRASIQIQQAAYLAARAGYRYIEYIKAFFGVQASDYRLQRSEYLGGLKVPFMISEVLQTSETNDTPQGNMSGHGVTAGTKRAFVKGFEEDGIVMALLSIVPKTGYFQGLRRGFSRKTRYDYLNPVFAHLGERLVLNKELYLQATSVVDSSGNVVNDKGFSYMPQYDEYRKSYSECHGQFRSSLKYWHLYREFGELPTLTTQFIKCNPSKRIFAVTDESVNSVMVNLHFDVKAIRPLPKFGNPGLMDHY